MSSVQLRRLMRTARHPEKNEIDRRHARAQLAMMLAGMTPEKLAAHTVDSLAAINRTPRGEIEAMLAQARQGRLVP